LSARVGIDLRRATWAPQVGISRYSRCLLNAMLASGADDLELKTLDLRGSEPYPGSESIAIGRRHHLAARLIQEQISIPRATRALDLLHLPWYEGPVWASCPLVVNVHDLDTVDNRDGYSLRFRTYYNTLLRIYLRTARRIIVPSAATLEEVERRWPSGRYSLVPYAVDPLFERPAEEAPNGGSRFILYSGGFGVRKRVGDLLQAFARVADAEPDVRLVIVGTVPPDLARMVAVAAARDRIELRGYIEDRQLVSLYRSASVVAYPSVLEGFGFPVLEAFATGTPVVATRSGSIPEIAGDACLLVRPSAPNELAEALLAVLRDEQLAARLVAAGRERNRLYRWPETARRTMDVYREALE
jgi:glycosyltransferase involved in cell wall biosynthesis